MEVAQQRDEDRAEDDDDLGPLERPPQQEDDQLRHELEPHRREVHAQHPALDQPLAAVQREHGGEKRRADEEPADHGGRLRREERRLLDVLPKLRRGSEIHEHGYDGTQERPSDRARHEQRREVLAFPPSEPEADDRPHQTPPPDLTLVFRHDREVECA